MVCRCCRGFRNRDRSSIWIGKEPKRCENVLKCWNARTVVGVRMANLFAVHDCLEGGPHGDFGLPVSNIAAEQPVHGPRGFHIMLDRRDGVELIRCQLELEHILELLLPGRIHGVGVSLHGPALRIQLEQLVSHVSHRSFDPGLCSFPGSAPQPVQTWLSAAEATVFLDEVQSLDRDIELGVPMIGK